MSYLVVKYEVTCDGERPFFSLHDCYHPAALATASLKIGRMFQRRKVMIGFLSGLTPDWECRHYPFDDHSALTYISSLMPKEKFFQKPVFLCRRLWADITDLLLLLEVNRE